MRGVTANGAPSDAANDTGAGTRRCAGAGAAAGSAGVTATLDLPHALSITQAASAAAGSDRMKANANIRACSIDFSRPP